MSFGPPFTPGDRVRVVCATARDVYDVSRHIGQTGTVRKLVIDGECGETLENPMIGVDLDNGARDDFWREELEGV